MRRFLFIAALALWAGLRPAPTWGQVTDDTPFLPASSPITIMGCVDTADAIDANDRGAVKCGTDREPDMDIAGVAPVGGRLPVDGSGVTQPVSDAGGSLTVDGTVAISGTANVNITGVGVNLPVTGIDAIDTPWGDNALEIVSRASTATPAAVSADGDHQAIWLDRNGRVNVADGGQTFSVDDGAGSLTVDGTVAVSGTVTVDSELPTAETPADNLANGTAGPRTLSLGMLFDGATWDRAPGNSTDGALVNLGANNDVSLNAGTNNIGDVDVLTLPNVAQATAANLNAEVQGDAAHDAAVSGNPVLTGGEARTSNGTAVANGDAVRAQFDVVGRQVTSPYSLYDNAARGCATATGTADTAVIAAAGVGVRNFLSSLSAINTSASTTAYIQVKDGTTVIDEVPVPPNTNGVVKAYPFPLRGTANTALNFASSTAVTTMRVCFQGFTGP